LIKEEDEKLISDARDQMVDLALKNRAFLERASNPSKRELKLFELGQCREARASVVVDGLIHKTGLKSHNSGIKTPILLDSGALGSSYVSKAWINENREAVRETYEISDTVTLGDGDTKQTINEEVDLLVDLKGPDGVTHSKVVRFKVMDTSFTHIIGLPDIEELFLDLFISLLRMGAARGLIETSCCKDDRVGGDEIDEKIELNIGFDSTCLSNTNVFSKIFNKDCGSSLSSPGLKIGRNSESIKYVSSLLVDLE
jgi:hypothetical protein